VRITRAWTSGIFGEYAGDNGGWLIDHFSVPFPLVNPHEGKRQDASHPEGQHSPATCPSPAPSYQGSSGGPYCFISLWWLQCRWDNSSQYGLPMESGLETQCMP